MTYNPSEPRDKYGQWTDAGGGGPLDAATFNGANAGAKGWEPKGSHLYLYHGTSVQNLRAIAASGQLETHAPTYGAWHQTVWPDGSKENRAYFMGDFAPSAAFTPLEGRPVVLRTKISSGIKQEAYTGDFYSTKPIPADKLEYLANDGQWHPLTSGKPGKGARTRNPVDRFPGIGGGATGSPVRHR